MDTPQHDYGRAVAIDAEAIGQPGQRRFRLLVRSVSGTAQLWMEKQQLAGIGAWLEEVCERLDRENPTSDPDVEPTPFAEQFGIEIQTAQVGLGYVEDEGLFAIQVFDADGIVAGTPVFRCFLSRGQSRVLSRKIAGVVAAGRPICPLCEMPMEPEGHVCPRSNGHKPAVTA